MKASVHRYQNGLAVGLYAFLVMLVVAHTRVLPMTCTAGLEI